MACALASENLVIVMLISEEKAQLQCSCCVPGRGTRCECGTNPNYHSPRYYGVLRTYGLNGWCLPIQYNNRKNANILHGVLASEHIHSVIKVPTFSRHSIEAKPACLLEPCLNRDCACGVEARTANTYCQTTRFATEDITFCLPFLF